MKSIYKKDVSNIKADATLIEKTKQKMKASKQSPKSFTKFQRRKLFRAGGFVAVAVLLVGLMIPLVQETKETGVEKNIAALQIEAMDQKDGMVSLNTAFIIRTKDTGLTKKELEQHIKITPEVPFELKKKNQNESILTLKESLQIDEIVNVSLTNAVGEVERRWAFQTENILKVSQTIPGHKETYVPVQTGIEFTLSTPSVTLQNFQKHVSISPGIKGEWKKNRNVFSFIPSETLKPKTVYQISLSEGLKTEDGQKFSEGYTLAFETGASEKDAGYQVFENANKKITETFLPEDTKVISITASESLKNPDVIFQVDIFRYASVDAYKKDLLSYSERLNAPMGLFIQPSVSKNQLTKIHTIKTPLQFGEQAEYIPSYVVLPEDMEKGLYYVEVKGKNPTNGKVLQLNKWIQISDVSVYQMKVEQESVFWVHDTKTGKAVSQAKVALQSDLFQASGQTNQAGILQLSLADDDRLLGKYGVVDIQVGKQNFIDLYQVGEESYHTDSVNYYSYLYTDRPVYLSSDTVEVWGMLQPRDKKEKLPSTCYLVLGENEDAVAAKIAVKVNENGMFSGKISFKNLGVNAYENIYLQDKNGKTYGAAGISIMDYQKPIYQLEVQNQQPITLYPTENAIEAGVQMNFYDGTPASYANLEVQYYGEKGNVVVPFQTNQSGSVRLSFHIQDDQNTWRPQWLMYDIQTTDAESTPLWKTMHTYVVYRDVSLQGTYQEKENILKIESRLVDISKAKTSDDVSDTGILGKPYNGKVTAEVHKSYYTKRVVGTYYDFIQKKNMNKYEYDQKDEVIQTSTVSLKDGKGVLKDLPTKKADTSYYVVLKTKDTHGKSVEETIWYENGYLNGIGSQKSYYFHKQNTQNDADAYTFVDNEDVVFRVQEGGKAVEQGEILAGVVQDGISEIFTADTPKVMIPFTEERVPNYVLGGAYFDGKHVYSISEQYMYFNPEQRALRVDVQSDSKQYTPGGKAKVEVKVTDAKTGKSVSGAEVSLSVVDEAVFAVTEQEVNPLEALYRAAFSPSLMVETSYIEHNLLDEGGAEKGSGGDGIGARKDFVDTAAFLTAQTDNSGTATFIVSFPDTLTSWRFTAQAITAELHAGYTKENVQVTQDFFVRSIDLDTFITGDDITIPVRSEGKAMMADEQVSYTVTIEGKDIGKKVMEASGKAGAWTNVRVGPLSPGTYTLTIQGKAGQYTDQVEKIFKVASDDIISIYQLQDVDLLKKNITPTKYPLTLEISRASDEMYRKVLQHLSMQNGNRSDERMARAYTEQKFSGDDAKEIGLEEFADVINAQGEVSLLPYADVDLALTAKTQHANLGWIPKSNRNGSYLYILGNQASTSREVAVALYGLAVNKQPVLNDILAILDNPEGFDDIDRLYLLAGLTAIGDENNALKYYEKLVREKVGTGNGHMFVKVGKRTEENLEATAIASLTASTLHAKEADAFIQYLMDTPSETQLYLMEMLVYLQNYRAEQLEPTVFQMQLAQEKETVTLKPLEVKTLTLYEADWAALKVSVEKGKLQATAKVMTNENTSNQVNRKFSLERKIEVIGGGDLSVGKKAKITLTPKVPSQTDSGMLVISDILPSGFRYIGMGDTSIQKEGWSEGRREGQNVLFYSLNDAFRLEKEEGTTVTNANNHPGALVYYVICVAPGSYTQIPAKITEGNGKCWGQSEKEQVIIQ